MFDDEPTAQEAFKLVSGEETQACYSESVSGAFAEQAGIESGTPQTAPLEVAATGDEHAASRVTLPVKAQGIEATVTIDLVFVRAGRGISLNLFVNALAPFEDALRDQLLAATVARLAAVPAG